MLKSPRKWVVPALAAFLLPALLAGFGASALARGPAPAGATAASSSSGKTAIPGGDPTAGQQAYAAAPCAACHGASLAGVGTIAPPLNPIKALSGVSNPKDPAYLIDTITHGRPHSDSVKDGYTGTMAPSGGASPPLSAQDIKNIAAYILSLNSSANSATYSPAELSRSTVQWVVAGIVVMVLLTWLLARYNMRWVARKAANRR